MAADQPRKRTRKRAPIGCPLGRLTTNRPQLSSKAGTTRRPSPHFQAEVHKSEAAPDLRQTCGTESSQAQHWGPKRPFKHKDPTIHDFWNPPCVGPQKTISICDPSRTSLACAEERRWRHGRDGTGPDLRGELPRLIKLLSLCLVQPNI